MTTTTDIMQTQGIGTGVSKEDSLYWKEMNGFSKPNTTGSSVPTL